MRKPPCRTRGQELQMLSRVTRAVLIPTLKFPGAGRAGEHIGAVAGEERTELGGKTGPVVADGTGSLPAAGPSAQSAACGSGHGVQEIAPKSYPCGLGLLRIYLLNILAVSFAFLWVSLSTCYWT